jgi:hypothetical protein
MPDRTPRVKPLAGSIALPLSLLVLSTLVACSGLAALLIGVVLLSIEKPEEFLGLEASHLVLCGFATLVISARAADRIIGGIVRRFRARLMARTNWGGPLPTREPRRARLPSLRWLFLTVPMALSGLGMLVGGLVLAYKFGPGMKEISDLRPFLVLILGGAAALLVGMGASVALARTHDIAREASQDGIAGYLKRNPIPSLPSGSIRCMDCGAASHAGNGFCTECGRDMTLPARVFLEDRLHFLFPKFMPKGPERSSNGAVLPATSADQTELCVAWSARDDVSAGLPLPVTVFRNREFKHRLLAIVDSGETAPLHDVKLMDVLELSSGSWIGSVSERIAYSPAGEAIFGATSSRESSIIRYLLRRGRVYDLWSGEGIVARLRPDGEKFLGFGGFEYEVVAEVPVGDRPLLLALAMILVNAFYDDWSPRKSKERHRGK